MLQVCNIQREAAMLLVYNWKINQNFQYNNDKATGWYNCYYYNKPQRNIYIRHPIHLNFKVINPSATKNHKIENE